MLMQLAPPTVSVLFSCSDSIVGVCVALLRREVAAGAGWVEEETKVCVPWSIINAIGAVTKVCVAASLLAQVGV